MEKLKENRNLETIFLQKKYLFFLVIAFSFNSTFAQDSLALKKYSDRPITELNTKLYGVFPKKLEETMKNLSIGGYYRFVGNYLHMDKAYYNSPSDTVSFAKTPNKVFIGDDSQLPELMLNISGKPSATTSFGTDLFIWNRLVGFDTTNYIKGLNLGVNLYGSFATKLGNFNIMTGGIHWYSLSPFTFFTNIGYNRFSIFERNPWDPVTKNPEDRYSGYFRNGGIQQDIRWGKQAFQGIIVEANALPKNFSGVFMYGKSVINGGTAFTPNSSVGGKIKKSFAKNFISFNTFSSKTYTDSLNRQTIGFDIHTLEYEWTWREIFFSGEVGAGKYFSPYYEQLMDNQLKVGKYGEAINLKVLFSKKWTKIPIELNYFRISPRVINNNSSFWNSSVIENQSASAALSGNAVLAPFASSMVQIGQMTNNRQGFNINAEYNIKHFRLSFGNSIAQEIENISSKITYAHPANNLALSRFWRWSVFPTAGIGPYGQLTKVYRGIYETVNVEDSLLNKKNFNSIEVYAKSNFKIFNKETYLNYFGAFSSIQRNFSPVTVFTEQAYVRTYYHQLECYFKLSPTLILTNYLGWERIIANYNTEINAVTRRPRNQEGLSWATGFDLSLGKNAGLYVRQRWMKYADKSFLMDNYKGYETTVELKIAF
jgi:hypothetical protein